MRTWIRPNSQHAHEPLLDPVALGDLSGELLLAHPFPEILKGPPQAIGHALPVVLDQIGLPQQEALQRRALDATAIRSSPAEGRLWSKKVSTNPGEAQPTFWPVHSC